MTRTSPAATGAPAPLSTAAGTALYVGALLGPSLLLLPGLAAQIAGPASLLVWAGLLALSGLLARVFTALGTALPSRGGVARYAEAGLGPTAGRIVGGCFLAGVVLGAPVVCLIGASYVAALFDADRTATVGIAAVLLLVVIALTLAGTRTTSTAQLLLVAALIVLVAVAVFGAAPSMHASNFQPFAPHGLASLGHAASVLMLSFVGWEAIAGLTSRLADPARQLPRVIGCAFAITSVSYLGLATATIAVLGARAGSDVPLADLLRVAIGPAGPVLAAIAAVALTLAATNAYLSGAAELAAELRSHRGPNKQPNRYLLQISIGAVGMLLLGGTALGWVSTAGLVSLPTSLFLTVYLGCTAAGSRILTGLSRIAAIVSCVVVCVVLLFGGWSLAVVAVIALVGWLSGRRGGHVLRSHRGRRQNHSASAADSRAELAICSR